MDPCYIDKTKLLAACPESPVTRFAPSPTGYLHLGHVLSMIYVFGIAEIAGAKVLLRIEDHDRERCRKKYEQAILTDMAWLGFIPHNVDDFISKSTTAYRQSDNLEGYEKLMDRLWEQERVYCCECSRKQLTSPLSKDGIGGAERPYLGTCLNKKLMRRNDYGFRIKLDETTETFQDYFLGNQIHFPKIQCGDFLIKDRRNNFTYNFCAVVDDIRHGINMVVRGRDILHCTGRQIALRRLLGNEMPPFYIHHPLLVGTDGKKLSKRLFSEGVVSRREAGETPSKVIGEALYLAGLLPKLLPIKSQQIPQILMDNK